MIEILKRHLRNKINKRMAKIIVIKTNYIYREDDALVFLNEKFDGQGKLLYLICFYFISIIELRKLLKNQEKQNEIS